MSNRQDTTYVQTSLFDDLMAVLNKSGKASSADIGNAIEKLKKAKQTAQRRETEARKRQEEQVRQKKKIEEQKRQEAHIQQVTSMDLPLDWENLFAGDTRVEGVHADSIPDGLILSLSTGAFGAGYPCSVVAGQRRGGAAMGKGGKN